MALAKFPKHVMDCGVKGARMSRNESSEEEGRSDYHVQSLKKSCTALPSGKAQSTERSIGCT